MSRRGLHPPAGLGRGHHPRLLSPVLLSLDAGQRRGLGERQRRRWGRRRLQSRLHVAWLGPRQRRVVQDLLVAQGGLPLHPLERSGGLRPGSRAGGRWPRPFGLVFPGWDLLLRGLSLLGVLVGGEAFEFILTGGRAPVSRCVRSRAGRPVACASGLE